MELHIWIKGVVHEWECFLSQVLRVYPYPLTVTVAQFAVGTVLVILMWTFNLYKRPKISGAQVFDLSCSFV